MTFRQQIETSSAMDKSFLLENFTKEDLFKNYENELNAKSELMIENKKLKEEIEHLTEIFEDILDTKGELEIANKVLVNKINKLREDNKKRQGY